jgi:predicted ATPase
VVAGTPLVTLVGAAGCGKTRLAVEVGEHLIGRFPGGVWFVDLAQVGDGMSVARAVAPSLDLDKG